MQNGPPIPWFVAEAIYHTVYGHTGQTLDRLAERGGFGWSEVQYLWTGRPKPEASRPGNRRGTNDNRARCRNMIEESCHALAE